MDVEPGRTRRKPVIMQIVIDRLALQDGKNVHFTPHVTLVGGIEATLEEATEASRRIASKLSPLELAFNDISCSTTYHQCVFMLAVKTTNLEKVPSVSRCPHAYATASHMAVIALPYRAPL